MVNGLQRRIAAGKGCLDQNVMLADQPVPGVDLTSRWDSSGIDTATNCGSSWVLMARLCNRGASKAAAGIPGTFYQGDPSAGGVTLCTATTKGELAPGSCETVKCTWTNPGKGEIDLWFVPDDDGSGKQVRAECKKKNNPAHVPKIVCPGVVD